MAGRFKITPPGLTPRRSPNLQPRITSPSLDLYGPLAAVCGKKEMCGTADRGGTLYLLTGTSNVGLRIAPNGRPVQDNAPWPDPAALPKPPAKNNVTIPRSIWTAGCCVWQEGNVPLVAKTYHAESFAVMTNNRENVAQLHQTEMSLQKLETLLTPQGAPTVNLFPGDAKCRLNNGHCHSLKDCFVDSNMFKCSIVKPKYSNSVCYVERQSLIK